MNGVPQGAGQLLPGLAALVLVLALILALAWLARRWLRAPGFSASRFTVISAMSIGPREKLLLVEIGGQQVLLGVTPGAITSLQTLSERIELEPARAPGLDAAADGRRPRFAEVLARASGMAPGRGERK